LTTSGELKTRETVATDRPARRATSVMLMDVNDFLKTFTLHPLSVTVR
jgi:hypothetical protein